MLRSGCDQRGQVTLHSCQFLVRRLYNFGFRGAIPRACPCATYHLTNSSLTYTVAGGVERDVHVTIQREEEIERDLGRGGRLNSVNRIVHITILVSFPSNDAISTYCSILASHSAQSSPRNLRSCLLLSFLGTLSCHSHPQERC
jgi:hypothetical protein